MGVGEGVGEFVAENLSDGRGLDFFLEVAATGTRNPWDVDVAITAVELVGVGEGLWNGVDLNGGEVVVEKTQCS